MKLTGKSFLFATFSMWHNGARMPTNGNVEPFRDYLLSKKVSKLVLLDQPVPSSQFVMPKIEVYGNNSKKTREIQVSWWLYLLQPLLSFFNKHGTRVVFKIRDFLSVLDIGFNSNEKFEYFVGVECINCLAGLILRSMRRTNKVIYYVLDLSPNRYSNKLMDGIYLWLDKICATHADFVWDVSKEFKRVRIENGIAESKLAPLIHVPIGLYDYQIVRTKIKRTRSYALAYVGTLGEENGPDLVIETLSILVKKYPQVFLHVIGGGDENIKRLKDLANDLKVTNKIRFYGFVADIKKMVNIISKFDIAIAPYLEISGSIRYYADSSKIRTYAGAGLPIVTTRVPPLGRELARFGGALIARDNASDMANAIGRLFSDSNLYENMRKKVMEFSKENTWTNEFDKAFRKMLS